MNFQQVGYNQALRDLGLNKEAGFFDSAARMAGKLFTRTPSATAASAAVKPTAMRTTAQVTGAPTPLTQTQSQFMEGLKSRTVAPQAPFKTMAEQAPATNVAAATRAKNVPGYDPAVARLQATPKTPVNIAQQNQFAGSFPEQATQFRQADQLIQARQQTPIVNSLFQNRPAQPRLQEAMSLFG